MGGSPNKIVRPSKKGWAVRELGRFEVERQRQYRAGAILVSSRAPAPASGPAAHLIRSCSPPDSDLLCACYLASSALDQFLQFWPYSATLVMISAAVKAPPAPGSGRNRQMPASGSLDQRLECRLARSNCVEPEIPLVASLKPRSPQSPAENGSRRGRTAKGRTAKRHRKRPALSTARSRRVPNPWLSGLAEGCPSSETRARRRANRRTTHAMPLLRTGPERRRSSYRKMTNRMMMMIRVPIPMYMGVLPR